MYFLRIKKSLILSIAGAVCLCVSALLLEYTVPAGIFSILGLWGLLWGGRCAENRQDIILNGVLLWIGHTLRFSGLFGTEFIYTLYCALLFIPYCAVLVAALFGDRLLQKSGHTFPATLVLPGAYSLCAFLLSVLNLGFISNLMGYLMCIPVVAVNLSLLGEYIMTFLLLWILVCLSAIWGEPVKKKRFLFAGVSVFLSLIILINGVILRSQWKQPDYTIKVAMATSQESGFTEDSWTYYTMEQQIEMFSSAMEQAALEDAKLLILNEEYFVCNEENTEELMDNVSKIVKNNGIPALIGLEVVRSDSQIGQDTNNEMLDINEAVYLDADGQIIYTYVKNNLVPFIEAGSFVDGEEEPAVLQTTIDGHEVNLAFVICYDVNDEMYLNKIPSSTELLIVPSWDWDNGNLEQRRTACRAATLGVTMIKHSFDGFSHVSCPNGNCVECVDFRGQYETVKTVSVPVWEK